MGREVEVSDDGDQWVFSLPSALTKPLQSSVLSAIAPTPVAGYVYSFEQPLASGVASVSLDYNGSIETVNLLGDDTQDLIAFNDAIDKLNIGTGSAVSYVNGKWQVSVVGPLEHELQMSTTETTHNAVEVSTYLGEENVAVSQQDFSLQLAKGVGSIELYNQIQELREASNQSLDQVKADIEAVFGVIAESISIVDIDPSDTTFSWQVKYVTVHTVAVAAYESSATDVDKQAAIDLLIAELAKNQAIAAGDVSVTVDSEGNRTIELSTGASGMQIIGGTALAQGLMIELPWQKYNLTSEQHIFDWR